MSARSILLVVAALLLTVGTVFVARGWLESQRVQPVEAAVTPVKPQAVTQVMVAQADLPAGTFLKEGHMRWQSWPDDSVPENYLVKGQATMEELDGAVLRRSISGGEPLSASRIVKPGERGFLAAVLTPGYRAVATKISAASGIAGLVFPGDRVDIVLTHTIADGEKAKRRASETVLTNVRVLALDRRVDDQSDEAKLAKTATLELTPKQVEILAVTRELGGLTLSLRSLAKDQEELDILIANGDPLKEPEPVKGKTYTWDAEASVLVNWPTTEEEGTVVRVARGGKVEEIRFKRVK